MSDKDRSHEVETTIGTVELCHRDWGMASSRSLIPPLVGDVVLETTTQSDGRLAIPEDLDTLVIDCAAESKASAAPAPIHRVAGAAEYYESSRLSDLRALCRERSMRVRGTKPELIERLTSGTAP